MPLLHPWVCLVWPVFPVLLRLCNCVGGLLIVWYLWLLWQLLREEPSRWVPTWSLYVLCLTSVMFSVIGSYLQILGVTQEKQQCLDCLGSLFNTLDQIIEGGVPCLALEFCCMIYDSWEKHYYSKWHSFIKHCIYIYVCVLFIYNRYYKYISNVF